MKVKHNRSSTSILLLISKSYWFAKPRFVNEGKLLLATSTPSLGAQPNAAVNYAINSFLAPLLGNTLKLHKKIIPRQLFHHQSSSFLAPLPGTLELQQGESHTLNHFTLFLSCLLYFSFSLFFLLQNFKTQKN